jgi:hypothetical protein
MWLVGFLREEWFFLQGSWFKASPGKYFRRPSLKKTHHKKGMVEWLKVLALSSSPTTTKNKKRVIIKSGTWHTYWNAVPERAKSQHQAGRRQVPHETLSGHCGLIVIFKTPKIPLNRNWGVTGPP